MSEKEVINVRIEIDSALYSEYKTLVDKKMLRITRLNNAIYEAAIKRWIAENAE